MIYNFTSAIAAIQDQRIGVLQATRLHGLSYKNLRRHIGRNEAIQKRRHKLFPT